MVGKKKLMPGDELTAAENKKILAASIAGNASEEERKKLVAELLKEFAETRHKNELEKIRQENIDLVKLLGEKGLSQVRDPWTATKYVNAGDYDLHPAYRRLLSESAFLATVYRYFRCQPANRDNCPTAGVRYDLRRDEFVLEYNAAFFHWMEDKFGIGAIVFTLKHEAMHIVLGHVTSRKRTPHVPWNYATDLVINRMTDDSGNTVPDFVLFPGRQSTDTWGDDPFTKYNLPKSELAELIESFDPTNDESSEWYFNEIMKLIKKQQEDQQECSGVSGKGGRGYGEFTEHNWEVTMYSDDEGNDVTEGKGAGPGELSGEDFEEFISEKARDIVERAVKNADEASNGWGNMSASYQNAIRRMVSKQVDWKTLLKQFWGRTLRGGRRCSIRRINRKYPYIHPGTTRSYVAKILAAIDESGSVGNEAVELLFAELANLAKDRDLDWVPFDTECEEKNRKTWKKGQPPPEQRDYCGGTCFQAPTDYANAPENRGRWDGLIILTDGMAPKPSTSRIRRAWIITPGCKLNFDVPGETVIYMDNDGKIPFNAWK
jgi:predicted metal-dependent peptidase